MKMFNRIARSLERFERDRQADAALRQAQRSIYAPVRDSWAPENTWWFRGTMAIAFSVLLLDCTIGLDGVRAKLQIVQERAALAWKGATGQLDAPQLARMSCPKVPAAPSAELWLDDTFRVQPKQPKRRDM